MLGVLWIHTVRLYIRLGLFFYFKKINVINAENIPTNKPVLILANHQNALLDALIIATNTSRLSYYLTRASAFNSTFISNVLDSLRMLPVYRMRDGIHTITKNNSIFKSCSNLLISNQSIVIFPEGNHNLKRTVRPLSKGFTRLVFEAFELNPNLDLQLVPVGFNYQNPETFIDEVSLYIGNPINAQDFMALDKNDATLKMKEAVYQSISKLTTNIPIDNYADTLKKIEELQLDFLKPQSVNDCILNNFQNCESIKKKKSFKVKPLLKGLLILNLWLPYIIWKYFIQPKIKEVEFISTFRFTVFITLVPVYLFIITIILMVLLGWILALMYLLAVILLALFVVKL